MSPSLGDTFPSQDKYQFIQNNLKVRAVIKFYCNRANKEKIFVVVADYFDKNHFGLVYINTEINQHFAPTEDLKALHLPLEFTDDREYLTHDCFVACNDIFKYSYDYLADKIFNSIDVYRGEVSIEDFQKILQLLKSAKTIKPSVKKEFGVFY